jgi:hypothetical protein
MIDREQTNATVHVLIYFVLLKILCLIYIDWAYYSLFFLIDYRSIVQLRTRELLNNVRRCVFNKL